MTIADRCPQCGRTTLVYALNEVWASLGFGEAIRRALRSSRRSLDAEALVRAMVFNRLCAADSKLGCLDWLQTVSIPGMPAAITHDQLLRTMDALMENADAVEERVAAQLRPMLDQQLSVVFYGLTTIRIHGEGAVANDLRAFGLNKARTRDTHTREPGTPTLSHPRSRKAGSLSIALP